MRISFFLSVVIFSSIIFINGCNNDKLAEANPYQAEVGEELTGGTAGTFADESVNAFNNQIANLSDEEQTDFVVGNSFNRNNWVTAPASTTARDGLGPMLNAQSCSACHKLDGRGKPPLEGESPVSMVFRLSISGTDEHGFPLPIPNYGDQLQNKAILSAKAEGDVSINYTELPGQYPDGTLYSLRKPAYTFNELNYGDFPADFMFSPRVAPKMTGAGFFDGLDDATILANSDPDDADKDGISGKPNYVWDYFKKQKVLGRIGWKASMASVPNQVAHAFLNDIGITSSVFPNENLWGIQKMSYDTLANGGNPEIDDETLNRVIYYTSALAMPARKSNWKDETVLKGKKIFDQTGCVKCHIPKMQTGVHPLVSQLSSQTIRIYSDLLLHDMGSGLADERPDVEATGREWRTAPLWGLSYIPTVNQHTFLLHDGRARNIEEAILWHGGEAFSIKQKFKELSKSDRESVLQFLETL